MRRRSVRLINAAIVGGCVLLARGAALADGAEHMLRTAPFVGPVRVSSGGVPLARVPGRGVSLEQPFGPRSALALGATNGSRDGSPELRLTLSLRYSF